MRVTWREAQWIVDDVNLLGWEAGDGPPLLILHGVDGGNEVLPFQDALAGHFRVLAPSLPGCGRTERPAWLDSVDDLAYFLLDLLEHWGLGEINVLGIGFGGWVAAEMAVRSQQRLGRLVLADAVGIKVSDRETSDVADMLVLGYDDAMRLTWHDPQKAKGMRWPGAPGISDEELTGALCAMETVSRLGWKPFMHNPKLLRRLQRIKRPTLVLWGDSDRVVSPDYGRAFHQAIPGSAFQSIPRAGHFPHRERSDDFVRAVTTFLLQPRM